MQVPAKVQLKDYYDGNCRLPSFLVPGDAVVQCPHGVLPPPPHHRVLPACFPHWPCRFCMLPGEALAPQHKNTRAHSLHIEQRAAVQQQWLVQLCTGHAVPGAWHAIVKPWLQKRCRCVCLMHHCDCTSLMLHARISPRGKLVCIGLHQCGTGCCNLIDGVMVSSYVSCPIFLLKWNHHSAQNNYYLARNLHELAQKGNFMQLYI